MSVPSSNRRRLAAVTSRSQRGRPELKRAALQRRRRTIRRSRFKYPDCDNMSDVLYELGAETWVRFGSNGIGFLNHKNSYNPQVSALWIS